MSTTCWVRTGTHTPAPAEPGRDPRCCHRRIREITTRSSIGMYRGALQLLSARGRDYQDWGIEVFWQPGSDNVGSQPYCFSATDSEGCVQT